MTVQFKMSPKMKVKSPPFLKSAVTCPEQFYERCASIGAHNNVLKNLSTMLFFEDNC